MDESDGPAWLSLAMSEVKAGNKTAARELFTAALQRTESVHLLQAWAVMERDEGRVQEARELFSRAAAVDPGNSYVAHAWGLMEEREGHVEQARALYRSALESNPTPTVIASLALLQAFHEDRPREALRLLETTASESRYWQRAEELLLAAAHIYETVLLQPDQAAAALAEALRRDPHSVRVRIAAAKLEIRSGDAVHAEALLHEARQNDFADPWLYNTLAALQARDARLAEAQSTIEEGISRFPFDGTLLQTAGTLAHRSGRLDDAAALYKRSLTFRKHGSTYVAWAAVEEARARLRVSTGTPVSSPAPPETTAVFQADALQLPADVASDLSPAIRAAESRGSAGVAAVEAAASLTLGSAADAAESVGPVTASVGTAADHAVHGKGRSLAELYSDASPTLGREWAVQALQPARALYEEGIATAPNHGALYNAFANMEARYGNMTGARAIYATGLAVGVSQRQVSLYHGAGNLEAACGNIEGARRLWKAGISIGLRKARAMETVQFCYHSLGMSYLHAHGQQQAPHARAHPLHLTPNATAAALVFQEGLSRYPASSQLLLGAALAEVKRSDVKLARELFRRSAAADKRHAQAWQAWAVMETKERNHETAATLFECGIENCPDHGALYQAYGMLQLYRGDVHTARKLFARGIARCPSHVPLYQGWACLELRNNQLVRARDLLLSALGQDRKHGATWAALGELERQASRPERARDTFEKGLRECPNSGRLYRAAARLEAELLNHGAARRLFQEGMERCPYDAPLIAAFAEFEASLGNVAALATLHHRAMELQAVTQPQRAADGAELEAPPQEVERVLEELDGTWDPLAL